MDTTINAKHLRATLPSVVKRVRKGARSTVLSRQPSGIPDRPDGRRGRARKRVGRRL